MRRLAAVGVLAVVVFGAVSLPAQRHQRGFAGPQRGFKGHPGGVGRAAVYSARAPYNATVFPLRPIYADTVPFSPFFGNAYGYGYGYGGYYPAHFPVYPYPAPLPQRPQYVTVILEATHDWRYWDPPTRIIVGPVPKTPCDQVIGMGVPRVLQQNTAEPLGDVARRLRLAAAARAGQPAVVLRIEKWARDPNQ